MGKKKTEISLERREEMPAFKEYEYGVDPAYQIPDVLWEKIEPILSALEAKKPPKKKPGRPRMRDQPGADGDPVRAADRLPVEGAAPEPRSQEHRSRPFGGVAGCRRVRSDLEAGPGAL